MRGRPALRTCPGWAAAPTFYPPALDQKRMTADAGAAEGCVTGTADRTPLDEAKDYVGLPPCCSQAGRTAAHGALWALDVRTGKVVSKAEFPTPNESGMLSTDGDLLFSGHPNGRLVAYDADTLKELWSFNVGTPITAPPMTYSVGGKQYIAVVAGGSTGLRRPRLSQPTALLAGVLTRRAPPAAPPP